MKERKGRTNKEWRERKNRRKTQEERTRGRVTWNKLKHLQFYTKNVCTSICIL